MTQQDPSVSNKSDDATPAVAVEPTTKPAPGVVVTDETTEVEQDTDDVVAGEGTKKRSGFGNVFSTIAILLAAPLIAVALTIFVFQSYEVDGPSMQQTLHNQDRLIVWKVPRTIARITNHTYTPNRGDIVIFVRHDLFETNGKEKQLIKRVVGLPGDHVVVSNGKITVDNTEHANGFDPDAGHNYSTLIQTPTDGNGYPDVVVQPGQVYVCGDNRVNSLDSRSFGAIDSKDIIGHMVVRIFPIKDFEIF